MMDHKGDSTKRIAAEIAEDSELGHDSATLDLDPARRYKALLSVNNAIVSQTFLQRISSMVLPGRFGRYSTMTGSASAFTILTPILWECSPWQKA